MAKIIPIDTPSLGDRSYLVHDGTTAFVAEPAGLPLVEQEAA